MLLKTISQKQYLRNNKNGRKAIDYGDKILYELHAMALEPRERKRQRERGRERQADRQTEE